MRATKAWLDLSLGQGPHVLAQLVATPAPDDQSASANKAVAQARIAR
jgi:hypothetical protein